MYWFLVSGNGAVKLFTMRHVMRCFVNIDYYTDLWKNVS